MRVSEDEIDLILERCRSLSGAKGNYLETDFIRNLFLTVLDFQMRGRSVEKAIQVYTAHAWNKIRGIDELQALLSMYPMTRTGTPRLPKSSGATSIGRVLDSAVVSSSSSKTLKSRTRNGCVTGSRPVTTTGILREGSPGWAWLFTTG